MDREIFHITAVYLQMNNGTLEIQSCFLLKVENSLPEKVLKESMKDMSSTAKYF